MKTFDRYFQDKMKDAEFKALYETECNVCANTMRIFEKADREHITIATLANAVNAAPEDVAALRDADRCDPGLVIRLCHTLELEAPKFCTKRHHASR